MVSLYPTKLRHRSPMIFDPEKGIGVSLLPVEVLIHNVHFEPTKYLTIYKLLYLLVVLGASDALAQTQPIYKCYSAKLFIRPHCRIITLASKTWKKERARTYERRANRTRTNPRCR